MINSSLEHAFPLQLTKAVDELLAIQPGVLLLPYSAKEYILLFPYRKTLKSSAYTSFQPMLRQLSEAISRQLGISLSFLYGSPADDPAGLVTSVRRLLSSGAERFYLKAGGNYHLDASVPFSQEDLFAHYPAASQELRDLFMEEAEEKLEEVIIKWMNWIREIRFPPQIVKEWVLKILYDNQVRLLAMQHYQSSFSMEVLHHTIAGIDNLDDMTAWVLKFFRERIPQVQQIYHQSRRQEIVKAKQYVDKHLNKKITLEEVAELLHINASYFSRLFKKETGHNFIHYVTLTKMERAKELLMQTNRSVEDIADQLGYDNKSYFTKLFKKYTGGTPGEYRG